MYDYRRVFFRRPFWTELNILYYRILLGVAIWVILFTVLSIRYFDRLPAIKIHRETRTTYLNFIQAYREVIQETLPPAAAVETPAEVNSRIMKLTEEKLSPEPSREVSPSVLAESLPSRETGAVAETVNPADPDLTAFLKGTPSTVAIVTAAIEKTPGLITPSEGASYSPFAGYRRRARQYEENIESYHRVVLEKIQVPPPEFTDFEVIKGVRNEEETMIAANENKRFIKHCIDRYYRNDPTVRGNIVVRFVIHQEGYVIPESIKIIRSDIEDPRVLRCIKRSIRRWHNFPRVAYEMGEYTITQKYIF